MKHFYFVWKGCVMFLIISFCLGYQSSIFAQSIKQSDNPNIKSYSNNPVDNNTVKVNKQSTVLKSESSHGKIRKRKKISTVSSGLAKIHNRPAKYSPPKNEKMRVDSAIDEMAMELMRLKLMTSPNESVQKRIHTIEQKIIVLTRLSEKIDCESSSK